MPTVTRASPITSIGLGCGERAARATRRNMPVRRTYRRDRVRYNVVMTAKQALRERVERLSEEEAAEWLARFEWESTETETLTDEEMDRVSAAEREFAEGKSVGGEEVFRKLGL